MTDRLLELAQKAGVVTGSHGSDWPAGTVLRPRLDIAHDLLAKGGGDYYVGLHWVAEDRWRAYWAFGDDKGEITDTIEKCVIALAERALEVSNGPE